MTTRGTAFLFAALQFLNFIQEGNGFSFTVVLPMKKVYKPGEEFMLRCYGTLNGGQTFHFMKLKTTIPTIGGHTSAGAVGGAVLSTFDDLDPLLLNETDRYSVSGSRNGTKFDYTLKISDVQPEDMGNFTCATDPPKTETLIPLTVLGPIRNITLFYQESLTSVPEKENGHDVLTYNATDGGYLVAVVEVTTLPPILLEATLFDPEDNTTKDVSSKFKPDYSGTHTIIRNGGLISFRISHNYEARITKLGPNAQFDYQDNGKKLTFKAQTEGFDPQEISTFLRVQFPPTETTCVEDMPQAPVDTANLTMICYTRSNPAATVTWKANDADLRSGITVRTENKGPYLVSILTIDEIKSSDYGKYEFQAKNMFGTEVAGPHVTLTEGSTIRQAVMNSKGVPWYNAAEDPNAAEDQPGSSSCGKTSVGIAMVVSCLAVIFIK